MILQLKKKEKKEKRIPKKRKIQQRTENKTVVDACSKPRRLPWVRYY